MYNTVNKNSIVLVQRQKIGAKFRNEVGTRYLIVYGFRYLFLNDFFNNFDSPDFQLTGNVVNILLGP